MKMGFLQQGIATTQFFLFGKKHCTKTGYLNHIKHYQDPVQPATIVDAGLSDGIDLTGKTFLITGANQGVGKEIATYAAAKNAHVYMLCRNAERAAAAQKEIRATTNNDKVDVLLGDVSEPEHIDRVVKEFGGTKLDCLVCNAGALFNDKRVNSQGKEITLMSHLVCGSYQLTKLLLPKLKKAAEENGEPRVIYVSSGGMYNTKFPSWEQASSTGKFQEKYDGQFVYSYAKRGQVLLAERFTKDYPDITFLSCHPGWTQTSAVDEAYGDQAKYLQPMRTTWEGAEGICWLASTQKKNLKSGEFYLDRTVQTKHLGGLFMTEGSFTKNSQDEVDLMLKHLQEECGV
jgi:dehydrogenase/reductase SDR family protein 12